MIGGTRCLADGTPNAAGEYLAPPYKYNTIVPHSGNTTGFIRTSLTGASLAWASGGADAADDDAIQLYVRAGGWQTRHVSVDADGNCWVAGQDNGALLVDVLGRRPGALRQDL